MNRKKKIVINIIVILIILGGAYYFGGYYISNDQCVQETLRALYATETEKILELKEGNYILTLYADMDNRTYSLVTTKRIGFLYHTGSSMIGCNMRDEDAFYVTNGYSSDIDGMEIIIYRNDPSITKLEASFDDGTEYVFEEWTKDFIVFTHSSDSWTNAEYTGYDCEGNAFWIHQLNRSSY